MERPGPTAPKSDWRRWARDLRPVDPGVAAAVAVHLATFLADIEGPVLGYVALADEVPIDAVERPVEVLPRLDPDGGMGLHLDDGARERHRVGIEQPAADAPALQPSSLAAVLVPGRVFDRDGYRLGRGGGHYDRLLPVLAPGTPVIGVATEARLVERLPREPHDVPMTHLATEAGVRALPGSR